MSIAMTKPNLILLRLISLNNPMPQFLLYKLYSFVMSHLIALQPCGKPLRAMWRPNQMCKSVKCTTHADASLVQWQAFYHQVPYSKVKE